MYIDIGSYGRISDAGVFNNSSLGQAPSTNALQLPMPSSIEEGVSLPYVIVADEAFALKPYPMKPYPDRGLTSQQRKFNYRLSRARRVVDTCRINIRFGCIVYGGLNFV